MKISLWMMLFLNPVGAFAASSLPDFTVQIGKDSTTETHAWILNFLPPPHYHFNINAPMKVTEAQNRENFTRVGVTEAQVGFAGTDEKFEGAQISAEIYLCDDAKTLCVRKTLNFALKVNSDLKKLDFPKPKLTTPKTSENSTTPGHAKLRAKDEHGFWDNDVDSALAESIRTKRPLFIDFYGIWCPPCNLYNETIFPKKEFTRAAKNWVLLKMDADQSASFALKSHFKVGGYPSLVEVKVPSSAEISGLQEIGRIVGYYPLPEFLSMLSKTYASRNQSLAEKLASEKSAYLKTLQDNLAIQIEGHAWEEALKLANAGIGVDPENNYFPLNVLLIQSKQKPETLKQKSAIDFIARVENGREKESTETLAMLADLLISESAELSPEQIAKVNEVLDTLSTRVLPETLSLPGVELSIADIDSMRVDVAEALPDPELAKKSYARTAFSYQKMIRVLRLENSRGMNLELAHALWKSGQTEDAKTIYEKWIKKYPREFTFWLSASQMFLSLKDYANAQIYAENAVKYAYGDNKIRSVEQLVRVLTAVGHNEEAAKIGNAMLAESPWVDEAIEVRTNRYLRSLKNAVNDAERVRVHAAN